MGTEKLVDLGAGSGYFTFRFAAALPGGKVTAIDVDPEMIRHLHHRSLHEKVANVEAILAKPDDPLVPADADLVFACDVVHHVQGRDAWLRRVFDEMKPGARLVVVDFKEGPLPEGPPENAKVPKAVLLKMLQQSGFVLQSDRKDLLPYQTFLTFLRPERKASMSEITYRPIGIIHSGFTKQEGTPVQSVFAGNAKGWLELDPAYAPALKDLDGFERIWVLYHLDRAAAYRPLVLPYLDNAQHGLFATRSPPRPNPIGISTLRLVSIEGSRVNVDGMDILDGTPLLDLKPYVPEFDAFIPSRAGWFDKAPKQNRSADSRFEANR